MKIEKREISKKLRNIKSIVPPKGIMQNQGILVKDKTLIASNLDITITVAIDVESEEQFILPPKAVDMIENLPDGEIEVWKDSDAITIRSIYGTSKFQTFSVDEFPEVSSSSLMTEALICDGGKMTKALTKVMYACSVNSTQHVMRGVLLDCDGEYLNIVACDGCRIAWNQIAYPKKFTAIIPKETLKKVLSIGVDGDMSLHINKQNAEIKYGDYIAYTRLLEGIFIRYRTAFKDYTVKTSVGRVEFLNSLIRSRICLDGKTLEPVVFEATGDTIKISIKTSLSEFNESVELLESLDEENVKMKFNPRYIIESLESFDEENIELHFGSALDPLIIKGKTMKALVLPVR